MKNLLFVAFQFPPFGGGSAVHRATRFVRYLGENGWRPYVLTASPRAYDQLDLKMQDYLPADVHATRAFALNSRRDLSFKGKYLRLSALPDTWVTWTIGAIPMGLDLIYRKRAEAILVTFPISTAVLIGLLLHKMTRKPLVVDFRDPMTEEGYPRDPTVRRVNAWLERSVIKCGARFIFTTPSSRKMYLDRYPSLPPDRCVVIPNGYDEEDFAGVDNNTTSETKADRSHGPFRLVHSGLMYRDERDPKAFFRALQRLRADGVISPESLRIELRASGEASYFSELAQGCGIQDMVHFLPALPHKIALEDTAKADGLLLFQAASCNHQIPGKIYEYIRMNKPILAVATHEGDTAELLRSVGGATIAVLTDEDSIYHALSSFLSLASTGRHPLPDPKKVKGYTRRQGARQLAQILDQVLTKDT